MNCRMSETGRSVLFFQGFNLIANLTALENVELPLIYRGVGKKRTPGAGGSGASKGRTGTAYVS